MLFDTVRRCANDVALPVVVASVGRHTPPHALAHPPVTLLVYAEWQASRSDTSRQVQRGPDLAGSGVPLFQAATANLNPWTEAKVDTKNPQRGPLLIISGEKDHTVPPNGVVGVRAGIICFTLASDRRRRHNAGTGINLDA